MEMMLDIETLDTAPTAVVFQIGAIVWDKLSRDADNNVITSEGAELLVELPIDEQKNKGRTASFDTMQWWLKSPQNNVMEAFKLKNFPPDYKVVDGLTVFRDQAAECNRIWAKTFFDFIILEHMLPFYDIPVPWHGGQRRDLCTLMKECGVNKPAGGNPHHALEDCKQQIDQLLKCREVINVGQAFL